jgi:hypothetical protein
MESGNPKGADFKSWKIGPGFDLANFSAYKLIRQRSFASKAKHYSGDLNTGNWPLWKSFHKGTMESFA